MPNRVTPRHIEMKSTTDIDWQDNALCRGIITDGTIEDDSVIFPVSRQFSAEAQTRPFREGLCSFCPVKQECLAFGLAMGYTGVWGGELLTDGKIRRWRMRPC